MTMTRTEAIKVLAMNGKTSEAVEFINSMAKEASRAYEGERADGTRTDEWKRWSIATYAKTYLDRMNAGLIDLASKVSQADRGDAARVFGIAGLPGDPASLVISMRDAADRVAETVTQLVEFPNGMRDLLMRATRSGDEVLARQIAQWATETQNAPLMEQFLNDRPALEDAGTRLWNTRPGAGSMEIAGAIFGVFPSEFSDERSIERAADEPEPGVPTQPAPPHRSSSIGAFFA